MIYDREKILNIIKDIENWQQVYLPSKKLNLTNEQKYLIKSFMNGMQDTNFLSRKIYLASMICNTMEDKNLMYILEDFFNFMTDLTISKIDTRK